MARPKTTDGGDPVSLRLSDEITNQLKFAAPKLNMSQQDVLRLCLRIGIEHLKRIDYEAAKCIVEAVESKKKPTPIITGQFGEKKDFGGKAAGPA